MVSVPPLRGRLGGGCNDWLKSRCKVTCSFPLGRSGWVNLWWRLGGGCNDWLNKSLTKQSNLSLPFGKVRMGYLSVEARWGL